MPLQKAKKYDQEEPERVFFNVVDVGLAYMGDKRNFFMEDKNFVMSYLQKTLTGRELTPEKCIRRYCCCWVILEKKYQSRNEKHTFNDE